MGTYINPFDFQEIFINTLLGGTSLLFYAGIFLFSLFSARIQMSGRLFITLLVISSFLFAAYIGQGIYILIGLIFGLLTWRVISRLWT